MIETASIVKLPGGQLRSQANFSLTFRTNETKSVIPYVNELCYGNSEGKSFLITAEASFRILNAELASEQPVNFTLYQMDLGMDKLIRRGSWSGLMNKFPVGVEYDFLPHQAFQLHATFLGDEVGDAFFFLNGIIRTPVR